MIYCPFYKYWIKCSKILFKFFAPLFMRDIGLHCFVNIQIAHLVFSFCPKGSFIISYGTALLMTVVLAFVYLKMSSFCFCFWKIVSVDKSSRLTAGFFFFFSTLALLFCCHLACIVPCKKCCHPYLCSIVYNFPFSLGLSLRWFFSP